MKQEDSPPNDNKSEIETRPEGNRAPADKRWYFSWWAFMIYIALFTLAGFSLQYRTIGLRISKDTTHFVEPVDENGNLNFGVALHNELATEHLVSEDNGYRLIFKRFYHEKYLVENVERYANLMGIPVDEVSQDVMYQEPYDVAHNYYSDPTYDESLIKEIDQRLMGDQFDLESRNYDSAQVEEILEAATHRPWTLEQLPMFRDWIDKQSPTLDLIARAVGKPHFEAPFSHQPTDLDSVYEPAPIMDYQSYRSFARGFICRANYYLGIGEIDKAIDDVISCFRLGRHLRNQPVQLFQLVGIAIEGIAHSIGLSYPNGKQPTKDQLHRLMSALKGIPLRDIRKETILVERARMLWYVDLCSQESQNNDDKGTSLWLSELEKSAIKLGVNWNVVARETNRYFDALNDGQEMNNEEPEDPSYFQLLISRNARSRLLLKNFLGYESAFIEANRRINCQFNLRQISLAMLLYEKEHGHLPPPWSTDEQGRQLHSWRVLLLPQLGHQKLFDQIRLDEPWDSPYNRKFWTRDLDVYHCPSDPGHRHPGETHYSVVVGTETPFQGPVPRELKEFGAASDMMILVAERLDTVCWMKPDGELLVADLKNGINDSDLGYSTTKSSKGIASHHPAGAQVGLRSGAADFLSETMGAHALEEMTRGEFKRRMELY